MAPRSTPRFPRTALLSFLPYAAFCALLSFCWPAAALAQSSYPHIEKVRVGLPGGQKEEESARSRNGAWAPVYIKLKAGADGNARDRFKLRVETTDTENTTYHYDVAVPALAPNEDYPAIAYIRPGTAGSDFAVDLLTADGQNVQGVPRITREGDKESLGPKDLLYLSVGGRLLAMKQALLGASAKKDKDKDKNNGPGVDAGDGDAEEDPADQKGMVRFAYIDNAFQMPDRWFGYDAADVVVLATDNVDFINDLNGDRAAAGRKALAEWVRRGGKLIVSIGANRENVAGLLDKMPLPDSDKMPLLNCGIDTGYATCPEMSNLARWVSPDAPVPPAHNVTLTRLKPGDGVSVLVSESAVDDNGKKQECPVVVESSCGLGRVWLTAFDVSLTGTDAKGRRAKLWPEGEKAFWTRVQSEFTPKAPAVVRNPQFMPPGMGQPGDDDFNQPTSLLAELQRSLENFEKVPVVNFGWVALFILLYIVIVGPLDYFLLTRVFKRPELTWVTFPFVVLTLSVLVYFVAYSMKGDDLRINKIDLVEYDLNAPQQAYGTAWFTLFSPRIQNYTIGLEPSAPGWAAPPPADATAHAVEVASLANPDLSERAGSSSLFRKPYWYAEDASGMERVPIPVWSTRTFQASWRAALDAAKPPLIASIRHGRDANAKQLVGEITNQLPVPLESVTVFYQGQWRPIPDLAPGQTFNIQALFANGKIGRPVSQWASNQQILMLPTDLDPTEPPPAAGTMRHELVKDLMFHIKAAGAMSNSGLRPFDQSWRLNEQKSAMVRPDNASFRDEVVLVARAPNLKDRAEVVARDPGSPTRLWLDRLPDGKAERPALSGYLDQKTFVRVYIPVQPPTPDKADMP